VVVSTCYSASAHGAEFTLQPAITVSEEYNDNLFLTTTDRKDDYITRVVPSVSWTYKSPLWDWDVAYAYDYRYYANYRVDQNLYKLNLDTHARIFGDLLLLDVQDVHARKPLSVVRDWTEESLFLHQTDTNTLIVTPYARMRTSPHSTVSAGYWYRNIWYQDPTTIDTIDDRVFVTVVNELSSSLTTTTGVAYTGTEAGNNRLRKTDLFAGFAYAYAMDSTSWFTIGNSWLAFWPSDEKTSQVTWDAGIIHKTGKYTCSLNAKLTYVEDPFYIVRREDRYVATISRGTERTSLGISAGRYEYRNVASQHLEHTRHALTGTISHASTQTSKLIYDVSIGRIDDYAPDRYTALYRGGVRFEYMPYASITVALQYRYANVYAPDVYAENHTSNRFILDIKKEF
jgi:hypothetical protein